MPISSSSHRLMGQDWLDQIFRAKATVEGGVIRRSYSDVMREIGLEALELEVRRRGFRMVHGGEHIVIFWSPGPVTVLC